VGIDLMLYTERPPEAAGGANAGPRAAEVALRAMLTECARTPGSYLMFVGD